MKKILVAEDKKPLQELYKQQLTTAGFEVVFERAKDGNWLRGMDSNHDK